ncbi:hypothetical protein ACTJKN_20730 [Pedobacter sp. 22163]|uniref:hypothetical protein n=1 Tax=Pedobacter sp. 22163 TaxID=3453883 RepID=UPI003F8246EB
MKSIFSFLVHFLAKLRSFILCRLICSSSLHNKVNAGRSATANGPSAAAPKAQPGKQTSKKEVAAH